MIYGPLDLLFIVLHSVVILFNMLGWVARRTRRANLLLLLATGLSWTVLGLFHGIGYCPLTDWHYQVLSAQGATQLPPSYMVYMTERWLGWQPEARLADAVTVAGYLLALSASAYLNWRDARAEMR